MTATKVLTRGRSLWLHPQFLPRLGFQVFPRGLHGITTQLEKAYRLAFERLSGSRRYRVVGLPSVEIYQATRISPDYELNQTDICIPLALR